MHGLVTYLIRNISTDAIKIGRSDTPAGRIRNICTGGGIPVVVLGFLPSGHWEKMLHEKLSADRAVGEWFRGTNQVVET